MANGGGEFNKLVASPTSTRKVHVDASSKDSGSEELHRNPIMKDRVKNILSRVIQVAASSVSPSNRVLLPHSYLVHTPF